MDVNFSASNTPPKCCPAGALQWTERLLTRPDVSERDAAAGRLPDSRSDTSGTRHLEAVHICPTCGGTGRWQQPPCEHDWRLVQSWHGPKFNLQVYACLNDGCTATLCGDCAADGFEVCA